MLLDKQLENFAERTGKFRRKFWKGLRHSLDKFMHPNNSKKKNSNQGSKFKPLESHIKIDEQLGQGASTLPELSIREESLPSPSMSNVMEIEHPVAEGRCLPSCQISMRSLSLISEIKGRFKRTKKKANFKRDDSTFQQIRRFPLNQSLEELLYVVKNVEKLCCKFVDCRAVNERKFDSLTFDGLTLKFKYEKELNDSFSVDILGKLDTFKSKSFLIKRNSMEESFTSFMVEITTDQNAGEVNDEYFFARQLYLKIKEYHDRHLKIFNLEFNYGTATGWHPSFDLEFVYNGLGYNCEFTEIQSDSDGELGQLRAAIGSQAQIECGKNIANSQKYAHLRDKIVAEILAREQLLASSTIKPDGLAKILDAKLLCEIAEHLKMTYQLKKVSNIFLSRMIDYFKSKIILSTQLDEAEIVCSFRVIMEVVPGWISIINCNRQTVMRMNHEISWPSVIAKLKSSFTNN